MLHLTYRGFMMERARPKVKRTTDSTHVNFNKEIAYDLIFGRLNGRVGPNAHKANLNVKTPGLTKAYVSKTLPFYAQFLRSE